MYSWVSRVVSSPRRHSGVIDVSSCLLCLTSVASSHQQSAVHSTCERQRLFLLNSSSARWRTVEWQLIWFYSTMHASCLIDHLSFKGNIRILKEAPGVKTSRKVSHWNILVVCIYMKFSIDALCSSEWFVSLDSRRYFVVAENNQLRPPLFQKWSWLCMAGNWLSEVLTMRFSDWFPVSSVFLPLRLFATCDNPLSADPWASRISDASRLSTVSSHTVPFRLLLSSYPWALAITAPALKCMKIHLWSSSCHGLINVTG